MIIKQINKENIPSALNLIWEGFSESIAPLYPDKKGIKKYKEILESGLTLNHTEFFGAYKGGELLGVIALRNERSHICYFFTHKDHKGEGIGKLLFNFLLDNTSSPFITVNASPYATEIYHRLGFKDIDKMQNEKGIIFTPMKYTK